MDRIFAYGCKLKVMGANRYPWVQIKVYGCKLNFYIIYTHGAPLVT